MPSACRLTRFAALLPLLLPFSVAAQTVTLSEAEVAAQLQGKTVFLRGFWADNTLAFDSEGHLTGTPRQDSFTTSLMRVTKVKSDGDTLHVDGERYGIVWNDGAMSKVRLKKSRDIHLTIAAPADHDYRRAVDAVFVDSLAHLIPLLPDIWQDYAASHFQPGGQANADAKPIPRPGVAEIKRHPDGTWEPTPPKLVHQIDPEFTWAARDAGYAGEDLIAIEVNPQGTVEHVRIVKAIGLGLDEAAVAAVRQYTFKPAQKNGEPVAVLLQVAVNFQIRKSPFHF